MEKITAKSTKTQILEAYQKMLEENEKLKSQNYDPVEEVKIAKVENAIANTEKEVELNESVFSQQLLNTYSDIVTAIEAKKAEIKEMYDIDAKLGSLVALINAYNKKEEELDASHNAKIEEYKEEIKKVQLEHSLLENEAKRSFQDYTASLMVKEKELKEEIEKQRKREEEEYQYTLARKKQKDADAWADEKTKREHDLAEREEIANELLETARGKMEEIQELREKVESIPQIEQNAYKKGAEEMEVTLGKKYGYEKAALKKDYECECTLLKKELESLRSQ